MLRNNMEINNVRYKLTEDVSLTNEITLKKGQEIGVLNYVVYVDGNLIPPLMQQMFYGFIKNNQNILKDISNL